MKEKKLVYYFCIMAISLTLFLPILNLFHSYKYKKISLQSFSKQELFSTDNLESLRNYVVYKLFNRSMNESQVIAGKDNFFFLGNGFAAIIDKTKGSFVYDRKGIDRWITKVKQLQDWYEEQGIKFILVVAPNKHTVYNDKLPNSISYKEDETITDFIVKASLNKNIHILNLKQALREKKYDRQLFFHTDTHWNHCGALVGYINTIDYLNTIYGKNYRQVNYTVNDIQLNPGGDLTNFLKINHLLSSGYENDCDLTFKKNSRICYGKITKTNKLKQCTTGDKNTYNQYSINENSPNKEKLLYLADSFGVANSKLYEETFNTVWRFHLAYMNGNVLVHFVQEHKPDIVIYQIVERDLGNNYIIDDMPEELNTGSL